MKAASRLSLSRLSPREGWRLLDDDTPVDPVTDALITSDGLTFVTSDGLTLTPSGE